MVILCERHGIYAGISVTTPDPASQTFFRMVFLGSRSLVCFLVVTGSPVLTYQSFISNAPMTLRSLPPTLIGGFVAPRRPHQRRLSLRGLRPPQPRPPGHHQ